MITIFTDGASRGNPGPGGWGAVVVRGKERVVELGGREDNTTNNRMELSAVIGALSHLEKEGVRNEEVTLYTDSKYVLNGITKWISNWKQNGWKTQAKKPVLNQELWQKLDSVIDVFTITWKLLPGHSGVVGNEKADEIATSFADQNKYSLYDGDFASYPHDILNISIDEGEDKKKREKKERSRKKAYSYLSCVDGKVVRHKDWASCEARVKGKSARFRKSLSAEDEEAIVKEWGFSKEDINEEGSK